MLLLAVAVVTSGCDGGKIDETKLYEGMDRSTIIANFGSPDSRKKHDHIERLTYKDGEHYKYMLMLDDGKLKYWYRDRVYKTSRFSNVRG